jgi:hypothetical protein
MYIYQWEEHRLRVFENRVLRRMFGLKRDELTEDWRKLHNEELHNLYSLPNIISRGVGCMDVVEALLPCLKMKPKYFCLFSISK